MLIETPQQKNHPQIKLTLKVMKATDAQEYKPKGHFGPRTSRYDALKDRVGYEIAHGNFVGDNPDVLVFEMEPQASSALNKRELLAAQMALYQFFKAKQMPFRCSCNHEKNCLWIAYDPHRWEKSDARIVSEGV